MGVPFFNLITTCLVRIQISCNFTKTRSHCFVIIGNRLAQQLSFDAFRNRFLHILSDFLVCLNHQNHKIINLSAQSHIF